jgi:molybdopterin/thiamine biosynthesis adenylyltransferase
MDYSRQHSLNLTVPRSVWLVGCGGVGYWTGFTLALTGVPELYLFDHDTPSDSNRNRIPYSNGDLHGTLMADRTRVYGTKSEILQEHIFKMRPDATVVALGKWTPELAGSLTKPEWLIATTDTHASRLACYQWAQKNGVQYLEAAAEGEFGSITGQPADFQTPEESQPGYASIPVWSGPCIAAAYLAAAYVLHLASPNSEAVRLGFDPKSSRVTFLNR